MKISAKCAKRSLLESYQNKTFCKEIKRYSKDTGSIFDKKNIC